MTKIITPSFRPRPYQITIMRKFLVEDFKRMLIIAHRRSGKDTLSLNMLWMKAIQKPGLYLHLLPKIGQSTTTIWKGRGKDGKKFTDYIPSIIIDKVNNTNQTIELVNGSIIKVTGADNFEGSLIGSNPMGIVFSEIQSINPLAWEYLRPILAENDGFAIFIGTTRGHNHLYDMYQANVNNPSWYVTKLTVDDTTYEDGTPVITQKILDEELASGMSEELFQQEFYCSFEAAIQGAYYSKQMADMISSGRLCNFEILRDQPVHTSWDIGVRDATSIGLYQQYTDGSIRCIYHMEGHQTGAEEWVLKLREVQTKLGFKRWGFHFLPHDVRVQDWGSGRTRLEVLQKAGINPRIVGNHKIADRIQCVRALLPRMYIHNQNCKHLVRALQEYHSEYDDKRGIRSTAPAKNWANHAADCFGYFAVGYMDAYDKPRLDSLKSYSKFVP